MIDGRPGPAPKRLYAALALAYATSAPEAGHEVRTLTPSSHEFPLIRSATAFHAPPPAEILEAQQQIR